MITKVFSPLILYVLLSTLCATADDFCTSSERNEIGLRRWRSYDVNFNLFRLRASSFNGRIFDGISDKFSSVQDSLDFLEERPIQPTVTRVKIIETLLQAPINTDTKRTVEKLVENPFIAERPETIEALQDFIAHCNTIIASEDCTPLKRQAVQMLRARTIEYLEKDLQIMRSFDAACAAASPDNPFYRPLKPAHANSNG